MTLKFFPYSWHIDNKQTEVTSIRTYGLNENNESVCIQIDDFTPYAYIELPSNKKWNISNVKHVQNKIDEMLGEKAPLIWKFMYKKKLYGAYIDENKKRKRFPYLLCGFSNRKDGKMLEMKLKREKLYIQGGIGKISLKIHELDADPILQLTCCRNITTSSWISFKGSKVPDEDRITTCDYEYNVEYRSIEPLVNYDKFPKPKIMGFDIEVNSSNPSKMPDPNDPRDEIFQISCVISREGENDKKIIISLGDPIQEHVGDDVQIIRCVNESKILSAYCDIIIGEKINIISGYNILGFDIPYMIKRAELNQLGKFAKQGFSNLKAETKIIKWSSSAYKNQEFEFLDAEGRLYVDLLPLVRRDYKFNNYKLKTISEYFIGATKDPLSVKGIFKCYRIGTRKSKDGTYSNNARKAISICAKYCVQDSALVVRLMEKLKTWVGLTEMASICNVPIFSLYTQGQQIKVYSQIYRYCMNNDIVVEKDGYTTLSTDRYIGAKVFPPKPGIYNYIVPFDFASLYPTTIIAYNIDYHTWVPDESNIPDHMCHIMEWEDHLGCEHDPNVIRKMQLNNIIDSKKESIDALRKQRDSIKDKLYRKSIQNEINKAQEDIKPYREERSEIQKTLPKICMCAKRRYRFLKEPKGVLPTIIQDLLDSRKRVRKVNMKECYRKLDELKEEQEELDIDNSEEMTEIKTEIDVLDKRQLAMKVSANSMYGAMGVRRGYLPFMPGAMCTTYMGRVNIEKVAKTIPEKYGGELVYGDTDSNYIHFPHLKNAQETWDHALHVAAEVTKMFPKPIVLEFEEEIYYWFFILSKKRYMYRKCLRDGIVDKKIGKKGVLLARRDNSEFVRSIYEKVVSMLADEDSMDNIIYFIIKKLNELCSSTLQLSEFIITKSVGDCGDLSVQRFKNEKGEEKGIIGEYTVPILSRDPNIKAEQLARKDANTEKEYYMYCLPAQVQLAERMKERGQRVDNGTRLEYVITQPNEHNKKQYEKIESIDYVKQHGEYVKIDFLYYVKALMNPLDQVLDIAFMSNTNFIKGFIEFQYKFRNKIRRAVLEDIKSFNKPQLYFHTIKSKNPTIVKNNVKLVKTFKFTINKK